MSQAKVQGLLLDAHQTRVAGARVNRNITIKPTAHSVSQPVIPSYGTLGTVKWKPSSRVQRAAQELTNLSGISLTLLLVCHFCHGTLFLGYVVERLSHETLLPSCPCFHFRLSRLIPIHGIQAPLEIHPR
ncbi:hypothetical protein CPAR01_14032 [Colletotrichum paranaense]|uniref:Uncharacterized protein n=1 Tax=Colletotrichum paranaense TaxID=1914294 RepID=A0ABQ9S304_9PEZI|nr:uncharacterized protein CPAR01_14032 [Colletotrichum paranaense]KAK1523179.1 hypothetical protein CPAR01_14032 [Colletotrichum paranaense]